MDVATITTSQYILENLAGARRSIAEAHALLAERPAIIPPAEHVQRAVNAACNAAEHLYDIGQVDEPAEAVHEALAAAEAIMQVVRRLRTEQRSINDERAIAAIQLRQIDTTLSALEQLHA